MNTQTVCRMCNTEGVKLHCVNTRQEIEENNTSTSLPLEDKKPMLACISCCDQLEHGYQVRNCSEQKEYSHTTMIKADKQSSTVISDIEYHNNACLVQNYVHKHIKTEPTHFIKIEVKQECITNDVAGEIHLQNNVSVKEDNENDEIEQLPTIINVKSENKIEIEIEPLEISTNEKIPCAPAKIIPRNSTKNTTFRKKNKLTAEKTVKKSRYKQSGNQPNDTNTSSTHKRYECDLCNKQFISKSRLITHIRIHTGEKPFQCNICSRSFNQRGHLILHNRTHTGDKPYSCKICNKSFAGKGSLVKHNRIHTGDKPYKCNICSKCFNQKSNLILHNRIHTGYKPFKCSTCGRAFNQKISLIKHNGTHTADRPYKMYFNI